MKIWKELLLKNVKGEQFKNAKTILASDRKKQFQIFEVLVTETLAVVDPNTQWNSLPVQGDDGVDFIGQISQINVPYLISKPCEIVLGQIKRRSGSYTKDNFHYDVIKIIEYYNKNYSQQAALFEIIHVLSTDKNVDPTKWLENITFPYTSYKILPVNAIDFFKFWKINPNFLKWELEGIYTENQLKPLLEYINCLQENWGDLIQINIKYDDFVCIDEEINVIVSFNSSVDLALILYLEWIPFGMDSDIVVIYPTNIVKNNISNYSISIYKNLDITIKLKAICTGIKDLGTLNIYSSSRELIYSHALGKVEVQSGIVNKFFSLPCNTQMETIKKQIKNNDRGNYKAFALIGQGGIGKTRLAQELLIFAQNQKYFTIAVQNANDLSNLRNVIFDMLIKILNMQEHGFNSYDSIYEAMRKKIGASFASEWNNAILNYLIGSELSDSDLEKVAKCILTLLIIQLHNQSIFIWLSDMHWASKETLILWEKLLNLLKLNEDYLNNSLIILFEGRDGDTLKLEDKILFPYKWLEFSAKENVKRLRISAWSSEFSRDYIQMLIDPMQKCNSVNKQNLLELLENYASGNPMHIKELLHYLIETENVSVQEDGTLILMNRNLNLKMETLEISEVIMKRLLFYRQKYSDVIDCYIILAVLCNNLSNIYDYIKQKLSKKYFNYPVIEKDLGIVSDTRVEKIFLHEYYKELLKKQQIQNENLLKEICNYYQKICGDSINEKLDILYLKMMFADTDFNAVSSVLLNLLHQDLTDSQALVCYQLLTKIPEKFRKTRILAEIYYEMSDIAIRIGSWKDSQNYLEKILNLKRTNEKEELYYVLACKNLGNMYSVGLELEKSLSICKTGLQAVENKLAHFNFEDNWVKGEFQRQYEMLLNRIAVTYWFSGQEFLSASYQEKALRLAESRNDIYSVAHTLYETGMRQLHKDIVIGNANIKKALTLLPEKSKYTETQERYLIRAELLISQILLYSKDLENTALLEKISKDSETICKELSVGNANYESSLCHIVNAIAHIFKREYEQALNCFFVALDCANLGEFNTLRWKLYLNIAETLMLIYAQKEDKLYYQQAIKYAQFGKKILDDSIELNKNLQSYCRLVEMPSYHFRRILGKKVSFPQNKKGQLPISVPYMEYEFYIMD